MKGYQMILIDIALITVLIICMITDYKNRKIYNKVLFPSLIIAFLLNLVLYGIEGIKISGLGLLMGFVFFLVPYMLRWIAAGDIKLVAVMGAFKGWEFTIKACLIIAVIGGIISLIYVIKEKQLKETMTKILYFLTWFFVHKKNLTSKSEKIESVSIPYGIAIGLGTFLTIALKKVMII